MGGHASDTTPPEPGIIGLVLAEGPKQKWKRANEKSESAEDDGFNFKKLNDYFT